MRVLLVHNRYQQKGGEDSVVQAEMDILRGHGAHVELLQGDNDHIHGTLNKIRASAEVVYSRRWATEVDRAIARAKPDLVHVHNWFPTLSPAVFEVCNRLGVPVVHTLHNYRLLCVKASLYRDGRPCEECVGTTFRFPGVRHRCYRDSYGGSAAVTASMLFHWRVGTWQRGVDRFIALSHFAKSKMIRGGLPAEKIAIKPNALAADPGIGGGEGGYFAYIGRLTDEKGIPTLLECWRGAPELPQLYIVGDGPLGSLVAEAAAANRNIAWLGPRGSTEVVDIMGRATAVICPSRWYEGMPRVAIESMAVGTPIIASRLGTYVEMIDDGRSGLLFEAGNPRALLACVQRAASGRGCRLMRTAARLQFEKQYSAEACYRNLLKIYEEASTVRRAEELTCHRQASAA